MRVTPDCSANVDVSQSSKAIPARIISGVMFHRASFILTIFLDLNVAR